MDRLHDPFEPERANRDPIPFRSGSLLSRRSSPQAAKADRSIHRAACSRRARARSARRRAPTRCRPSAPAAPRGARHPRDARARLQRVHHRVDLALRVAQPLLDLLVEPLAERLLAVAQLLLARLELAPASPRPSAARARPAGARARAPASRARPCARCSASCASRAVRCARACSMMPPAGRAASRSRARGCCPAIRSAAGRSARTSRGLKPNPADVTPSVVDAYVFSASKCVVATTIAPRLRKWSMIAGRERAAFVRVGAAAGFVEQHQRRRRPAPCPSRRRWRCAPRRCSGFRRSTARRRCRRTRCGRPGSAMPSAAGISSPACAIIGSSPAVFSATVLPPVFGPVMTSTRVGGIEQHVDRASTVDAPRAIEQRMPRRRAAPAARPAIARQHAADVERVARLGLHDVERRRRVDRALQLAAAAAGTHRSARAGCAGLPRCSCCSSATMSLLISTVLSGSRNRLAPLAELPCTMPGIARAVFRADDEHVAAVAVGDDLLLQVLRRVLAAQVGLERAAQTRALLAQPIANALQLRTGIVHDLAAGIDLAAHVGDLALERGGRFDDRAEQRERRAGAADAARRWRPRTRGTCARPSRCSGSRARPSTASASTIASSSAGARSAISPVPDRKRAVFGRRRQRRRHRRRRRAADAAAPAAPRRGASAPGARRPRRCDRIRGP